MPDVNALIRDLQKPGLFADCPHCNSEIALSEALLFDGTREFPSRAEEVKIRYESDLTDRILVLDEGRRKAKARSETAAVTVGIGKIVEKIIPCHKDFNFPLPDCRFLAEPIDMMVFEGATKNRIDNITFMEIKTGKSRLTPEQRSIRDAINDHNVKCRQV